MDEKAAPKKRADKKMSGKSGRFQFTIRRLALAVCFAAIPGTLFTIDPDVDLNYLYVSMHALVSFMAGGAAVGVLFGRAFAGATVLVYFVSAVIAWVSHH
jgi:hypothetical protein